MGNSTESEVFWLIVSAGTSKRSSEDDSEMDNDHPSKRQRLEGMHAELRLLLPSRVCIFSTIDLIFRYLFHMYREQCSL